MASARGERACVSSPSKSVIFVVSPRESGVSKRYHPFYSSSPRLPTRLQLAKCPSTVTSLIPFSPDLFFNFFPFSFDQSTLQMIYAASTRQDGIRHIPFSHALRSVTHSHQSPEFETGRWSCWMHSCENWSLPFSSVGRARH